MSAIDFYCSVDKVKGVDGKDHVVQTFDGKYLPYTEQESERYCVLYVDIFLFSGRVFDHMVSRLRKEDKQDH
ncbi:hypothetical protein BUALT_Bualt14G0060200 [Buddleja alternifolia]|uniref:Cyanate lyase C-terminal domain-containing protein n=1 Tax=Buddleja alternifolia TaxID=168488 RepID=A0AAV6WQP6_9LAMI|nr:hypothetical protein BUALT_Bualt14G0060200 [Buddleja alternifolia]